jgi:hypothetical protein
MAKAFRAIFTLIIAELLFFSCNTKDPFYDDFAREDLYRLPLLKPYELINIYGIDPHDEVAQAWSLELHYIKFNGYDDHVLATDIQVSNGVIFGHGRSLENFAPNDWFVIIPAQKVEQVFSKKVDWTAYLKQKNIQPEKLYRIWPVFQKYKDSAFLPWLEQTGQER